MKNEQQVVITWFDQRIMYYGNKGCRVFKGVCVWGGDTKLDRFLTRNLKEMIDFKNWRVVKKCQNLTFNSLLQSPE